jgi:hypothetical protein
MRKKSIFILLLVFLLSAPAFAIDNQSQDLVEMTAKGSINWTKGTVRGKGIGAPPEQMYGKPSARPMAIRAAKLDAYRNILEVVNGVRIDGTTIVRDYAIESDIIMSKVEGMVQGAELVNQEYLSDGTVEVIIEMSIRGGFSQLILPEEIKQMDSIKPAVPAANTSAVYTGMVVDAKGLKARPAMSPKIIDENGQEVYGSAYVSREYAVQQGMSGYAKDISAARKNPRVTDNPLTVKGLRTEGAGRSDIVISNADASMIRSASENLSFMKKCRVIIVVD